MLSTPPPAERDAYVADAERAAVFSSRRWFDPRRARQRAAAAFDRAFSPRAPSVNSPPSTPAATAPSALAETAVPTLVIHGRDDTLITPTGGIATAEAIPDATLLLLAHMGHDLPEPLWPVIVAAIAHQTTDATTR